MQKQTYLSESTFWKNAQYLLPFVGVILVFAGILGVIFGQKALSEVQDTRSDASTTEDANKTNRPIAAVYLNHSNPNQILEVGREGLIRLELKTEQTDIEAIQAVFYVLNPNLDSPRVSVNLGSGYEAKKLEVEKVSGGYLVQVVAVPAKVDWLVPPQDTSFLHVYVTASKPGMVNFTFDVESSLVYTSVYSYNLSITNHSYPVAEKSTPTPSPSVSPSPSPSPSILSCNQSCSSNAQCAVGHRCFDTGAGKFCRLATNPTNASCQNQQAGLNRQCNQYCADTSECGAGFSCWFNRCRNPKNVESTTCAQPTVDQQQAMAQSCRTTCSSNADCAVNLRCYNKECRLATNVSSLSCSAVTQQTISDEPAQKGATIDLEDEGTTAATPTAKPRIVVTPPPTLSPTPVVATPEPVVEKTLGESFLAMLKEKNISMGTILIAAGVGTLLVSILIFTFGRKPR